MANWTDFQSWLLPALAQFGLDQSMALVALRAVDEGGLLSDEAYRNEYRRAHAAKHPTKADSKSPPDKPASSSLSRINQQLLAPACFFWGMRDRHFMIPGEGDRRVQEVKYKPKLMRHLERFAKRRPADKAESLLAAWLSRSEAYDGFKPPEDAAVRAQRQFILKEVTEHVQRQLSWLADCVADRSGTDLFVIGDAETDKELRDHVHNVVKRHAGTPMFDLPGAVVVRFEAHEGEPESATRMLRAAHQINAQQLKRKSHERRRSQVDLRMLAIRTKYDVDPTSADWSEQLRPVRRALGSEPAGVLMMDGPCWRSAGRWANARRTPSVNADSLDAVGRGPWSRLLGLGDAEGVLTASAAEAGGMIGREAEQRQLREIWSGGESKPYHRVVAVCGEPGMGKRLFVDDFLAERRERDDAHIFELDLRAGTTAVPYQAFLNVILRACSVKPQDSPPEQLRQLEEALRDDEVRSADLKEIVWLYRRARVDLGADGSAGLSTPAPRRSRLSRVIKSICSKTFRRLAEQKPVILAVLDAQQAEGGDKRLLEELCRDAVKIWGPLPHRVTILVTGIAETFAGVEVTHRISLGPLAKTTLRRLSDSLREQGGNWDDSETEQYADESKGCPGRFVDGLLHGLQDDGADHTCDATLTRLARADPSRDTVSSSQDLVGAVAALALLGESASPQAVFQLLLQLGKRKPNLRAASKLDTSELEGKIAAALHQAHLLGVLDENHTSTTTKQPTDYAFRSPAAAAAIRGRLREHLNDKALSKLAHQIEHSGLGNTVERLLIAADIQKEDERVRRVGYLRRAGESLLQAGEPETARKVFREAYRACWPNRHKRTQPDAAWAALACFCGYLRAFRANDFARKPFVTRIFEGLIRIASANRSAEKELFSARLLQWHLAEASLDYREANRVLRACQTLYASLSSGVTPASEIEYSYAIWTTSLVRGNLPKAMRAYAHVDAMILQLGKQYRLSSQHHWQNYGPAKQAPVWWLAGQFRTTDAIVAALLDSAETTLTRLQEGLGAQGNTLAREAFWSVAYLLPVSLFEGDEDRVSRCVRVIRGLRRHSLGPRQELLARWLVKVAHRVGSGYPVHERRSGLLPVGLKYQMVSKKYASTWCALLARRHLEHDATAVEQERMIEALKQCVASCEERDERFLLAELHRLLGMAAHRSGRSAEEPLQRALGIARRQGAAGLELQILCDADQALPAIRNAGFAKRFRDVYQSCDFPPGHWLKRRCSLVRDRLVADGHFGDDL